MNRIESMQSVVSISGRIETRLLCLAFAQQWVIGVCRESNSRLPAEITAFSLLEPPIGVHYADPFIIFRAGRSYVFFEVWRDDDSKGSIWVTALDAHRLWGCPEPVLERPYHLSYPFVFDWHDDLYMLPETQHNHTIELYRCVKFPRQWELAGVLMDRVDAVDTTLFEQNGRWWMFAAGFGDTAARFRQLSVFYADSPFGPWRPHSRNPVVDDLSAARPAGRLFMHDGHLIRPGQDSRLRYGHSIAWNRVDILNDGEYHETCIGRLKPRLLDGWLAAHTFNQAGDWQVLDGKRLVRRTAANRAA